MNSFLQQLPTLAGVLVGALATYAATSAAEHARWRRAQSVRWDEKRVNAYWHNSVFRLERLAHGKPVDLPLPAAIEAISQARRDFYEAAKGDIGIDVGASADAYEWQLSKTTDLGLDDGDPTWYRSRRFSGDLPDCS